MADPEMIEISRESFDALASDHKRLADELAQTQAKLERAQRVEQITPEEQRHRHGVELLKLLEQA